MKNKTLVFGLVVIILVVVGFLAFGKNQHHQHKNRFALVSIHGLETASILLLKKKVFGIKRV